MNTAKYHSCVHPQRWRSASNRHRRNDPRLVPRCHRRTLLSKEGLMTTQRHIRNYISSEGNWE